MSALGHKRTGAAHKPMSLGGGGGGGGGGGEPSKADINCRVRNTSFGLIVEVYTQFTCAHGDWTRTRIFLGASRGKANVDFDRLCFDCRNW